jgi:hypothetical protein
LSQHNLPPFLLRFGACGGEAWAGEAVGFPFFLPVFYYKGSARSHCTKIIRKAFLLFYLGWGMLPRFGFCFLLVIGFGFRFNYLWQFSLPLAGLLAFGKIRGV